MTTANTAPSPILLILAEFAGAVLGGVLLRLLCVVGVALILANSNLGMGVLTVQVYGGIIGFALGTGLGAALGGRIVGRPGNWGLAVLASVITGILVAVIMRVLPWATCSLRSASLCC